MNNKKSAIAATIIMAGIGFGLGGGVSIISNTPIFLTTLTFTSTCAILTAAQTGLIAEVIEKIKNRKINNDNVELHPAAVEHVQELTKEKNQKMSLDSFMEKQTNDENKNLVDSAIELHNELNGSNYDLDSLRRIYSKTSVSECFEKDNPSNCDTGSVTPSPVLKKVRNRHI